MKDLAVILKNVYQHLKIIKTLQLYIYKPIVTARVTTHNSHSQKGIVKIIHFGLHIEFYRIYIKT